MSFGKRLRVLREEKGILQKDLGKVLDLQQRTISNYESDDRFKYGEILIKIADYFDVSIDYLLGRVNNRYTGTKEEEMILTMKRKMTPEQFDKWTRITKEIFPDIFE